MASNISNQFVVYRNELNHFFMKHLFIIAGFGLLAFTSCKKGDGQNTAVNGPYTSLSDVYGKLAPTPKTTSISVSSGGTVTASGGTRYVFPPNAFVTSTGASVTGSVQVVVNDWLNRADMIFGKVIPISNGNSLESGGQAYVSVTQNGQEVFMKPGSRYEMKLPQFGKTVSGMDLFRGKEVIDATNTVQWRALDSNFGGYLVYNGDTISMFSDSMGYYNADRFMSSPNYQSFTVNASDASIQSMTAFALYDNVRGMWSFTMPSAEHIPNIPVHIVVMGIKNGDFYGGILGITPQTGQTYTVPMAKVDVLSFRQQINQL